MPRIGGKPKAQKDIPPIAERLASSGGVTTDNPLAQSTEESRKKTVDSLVRSKKRVWNTKGRLRKARFHTECEMLRLQGFSPKDTAEILGCEVNSVHYALRTIRKDADIPLQLKRLDDIGVPLAVDNVLVGIQNGDKEYTLRLMDGRGLFRTHKSVDSTVTQKILNMTINVVDARTIEGAPARPGSIVGAPETFDAVVIPQPAALPAPIRASQPDPVVSVSGPVNLT